MLQKDSCLDDVLKNSKKLENTLQSKDIDTILLNDIIEKMIEIKSIVRIEKIFEEKIVSNNPVVNVVVNDGSGRGLLSLWSEQIGFLEGLHEGDAILIENAHAPKKYKDRIHLALSKSGKISKIESDLPSIDELLKKSNAKRNDFSRKFISELNEGMGAELRGLIVAIHSKEPYFPVCDKCNKKMVLKKGYAVCKCGNKVDEEDENLKWLFLCTCTLDDGSKTIRLTLNDNTKYLDFNELKKIIIDDENILDILNDELLGLDILTSGFTTYDEYLKDTTFRCNSWDKLDVMEEFNNILKG
ncbi:DNA-binding protein [Methanococcus sp. CF]